MNAPEISPFSSISQRSQLMDSSVPAGVVLHASGKDIRGFPTASNAEHNKLVHLNIYEIPGSSWRQEKEILTLTSKYKAEHFYYPTSNIMNLERSISRWSRLINQSSWFNLVIAQ